MGRASKIETAQFALLMHSLALSESAVNMISGTAGGVAQVFVGHPFDTIKVTSRLSVNNSAV